MFYDFVEIGTSDFNTLLQSSKDHKGLSIDPLQFYLDRLPNRKNVKKACLGISNVNKEDLIYYISPENIKRFKLPYYLRGCNSISKPHDYHSQYPHLVESQKVEIIDTGEMIKRFNIEGIKYLKIDTEGHDPIILLDYIKHCINNPKLFPEIILFEGNVHSSKEDQIRVIKNFQNYNYLSTRFQTDILLVKSSADLSKIKPLNLKFPSDTGSSCCG
jgi:hypothetical protein